jgi:hypothetical protein
MLYWAPPALGARLARRFNEAVARVACAHPDRFVAFAAVRLAGQSGRKRGVNGGVNGAGPREHEHEAGPGRGGGADLGLRRSCPSSSEIIGGP